MLSFHLVRLWRQKHTTLGKMGSFSKAKSPRRMGAQKHFSVLKRFGSKNRLVTHHKQQPMVLSDLSKIYSLGDTGRLDHIPKQVSHFRLHFLEISYFLLFSYWWRTWMDNRSRKYTLHWSRSLAWKWDLSYSPSRSNQPPPQGEYFISLPLVWHKLNNTVATRLEKRSWPRANMSLFNTLQKLHWSSSSRTH